jgi:hypothetical protein
VVAVSMYAECALVRGSWCSSLHSSRKVVKEVFAREGSFEERGDIKVYKEALSPISAPIVTQPAKICTGQGRGGGPRASVESKDRRMTEGFNQPTSQLHSLTPMQSVQQSAA